MPDFTSKDRLGLWVIGIVVVGFLLLFGAYFSLSQKESLDERGCGDTVGRKTVFLIDRSDDTPTQTTDEILARLKRVVRDEVQDGELVSIFYVTNEARQSLRPLFSGCKPQSEANIVYEDEGLVEKRFREGFQEPLEHALAKQPSGSDVSPIAEVLTDLSASNYLDGQANRLVIFSDMMQNSVNLSLYGCTSRESAVAAYRDARAGAIERPKLANVEVDLNVIPREAIGRDTLVCRDGFWTWFFGDNEGSQAAVDIRYLPGGMTVE